MNKWFLFLTLTVNNLSQKSVYELVGVVGKSRSDALTKLTQAHIGFNNQYWTYSIVDVDSMDKNEVLQIARNRATISIYGFINSKWAVTNSIQTWEWGDFTKNNNFSENSFSVSQYKPDPIFCENSRNIYILDLLYRF